MKICAALLAMLTFPLLAYGDHCRSRVVAVKQVVAVQQYAAYVAPVYAAVYVPAYSASYDSERAAIIQELRLLREELRQGRGEAPAQALSFNELVKQRCAACHIDGKADANGGGFVMLEKDGTVPPFSLPEQRRIKEHAINGTMPPKNPLPDREKKAFAEAFAKKE